MVALHSKSNGGRYREFKEKGKIKMKAKKIIKEKEKNPLHKDYPLRSNLKFIFGTMFREEKALRYLIPMGIVVAPIMSYLWNFTSRSVIELITEGEDWKALIPLILTFIVSIMLACVINTYYWSST